MGEKGVRSLYHSTFTCAEHTSDSCIPVLLYSFTLDRHDGVVLLEAGGGVDPELQQSISNKDRRHTQRLVPVLGERRLNQRSTHVQARYGNRLEPACAKALCIPCNSGCVRDIGAE